MATEPTPLGARVERTLIELIISGCRHGPLDKLAIENCASCLQALSIARSRIRERMAEPGPEPAANPIVAEIREMGSVKRAQGSPDAHPRPLAGAAEPKPHFVPEEEIFKPQHILDRRAVPLMRTSEHSRDVPKLAGEDILAMLDRIGTRSEMEGDRKKVERAIVRLGQYIEIDAEGRIP